MSAETTWRRRWKPTLQSSPWKNCSLPGQIFVFKFLSTPKSYEFILSDNVSAYSECLEENQILHRTGKLNPSVEAPLHKILDHIRHHMDNLACSEVSVKVNEEKCVMSVETTLAGLPFVWKFNASKCEPSYMYDHMTLPLMGMVAELLRRQSELAQLLHRKDKEIDDYKAQGAKVTRKHLQTAPFDTTAFNNNMVTSQGFQEAVSQLGENTFTDETQNLYSDVMMKHAWLSRDSDDDEEYEGDAGSPARGAAGQSWSNRVPGSLVSPSVSPDKSPNKQSPNKTVSPEKHKDTELMRRQALEKRLAEEEDKKEHKKKKKKLKL